MQAKWLDTLGQFTKKNSPAILSGVAIGGVVVTAVLASRATLKASKRVEEAKKNRAPYQREQDRDAWSMPVKEVVKICWPLYIPAGLAGAATIASIIGAHTIDVKRNASLVAAYTLADQAFREYKDHVLEEIGEAKERKIQDKISQDFIEANPPDQSKIIITGAGEQLCCDMHSKQYFRSDIEKIRQLWNDFNQRILLDDMYASLNDWYILLGIEPVDDGDILGWNVEHKLELGFGSHLSPGGIACLAVRFTSKPLTDYEH